jgi:hypothetical protein
MKNGLKKIATDVTKAASDIEEGWRNYYAGRFNELYKKRKAVCTNCPTNQFVSKPIGICLKCKCPSVAALRVPGKPCPDNHFNAE